MKKSSVFKFIIWGAIFGFLAGYLMTRLSEIYMYSNVFGGPYVGHLRISNYDKVHAHFMMIVVNLTQFIILGLCLGLANGISNRSIRRTIYSVLSGIVLGILCFLYYAKKLSLYSSPLLDTISFIYLPCCLYFYTAAIIVFDKLAKRKTDEIRPSLSWSLVFVIPWMFMGIVAFLASAGVGFSGHDLHNFFWRKLDAPYYIYYMIAGILINISINVAEWKKDLTILD